MLKPYCVWLAEVSGDGKNPVGSRDAAPGAHTQPCPGQDDVLAPQQNDQP